MAKPKEAGTISADHVADLIEAVGDLKNEVRVLREAIDDLRMELEWGMRNRQPPPAARQITSLPLDPAQPAREWADQVNRFTAADLPPENPPAPSAEDHVTQQGSPGQRQLF